MALLQQLGTVAGKGGEEQNTAVGRGEPGSFWFPIGLAKVASPGDYEHLGLWSSRVWQGCSLAGLGRGPVL